MENDLPDNEEGEIPENSPQELPDMPEPEYPDDINNPKPGGPFIPADQPDKKPEENV